MLKTEISRQGALPRLTLFILFLLGITRLHCLLSNILKLWFHVFCLFFFLACLGHEDKSGPYICIMALPSLRPYVINHLQQNCFAVQKLLQAKGIGSAQALRQKKVWHNMCFRNSSEIMGQMQIE